MDGTIETSDIDRKTGREPAADRVLTDRRWSSLGAKMLRLPPGMQSADGFALRLQPGMSGSIEKTIRRLAPLLAAGKNVTLDISSLPPSSKSVGPGPYDLVRPLVSVSQGLAARGLSLESASIAVSSDHPDTPLLAAGALLDLDPRRLVIRISDEFLRAVQFDRELATHRSRPGGGAAGTPSPRQIWWTWLEQAEEKAGPGLFIDHDDRSSLSPDAQCLHSVASPLLIKAPDYGAQIVLELDLEALSMAQLWRPGCLSHDLVRLVDGLLETTLWPAASIALHAQHNRRAILWLRGLLPLSRRLSRRPAAACVRLRELIEAFRRSLMLASRRYFLERAGQRRAPDWVADIHCPDLRQQFSSRLDLTGTRPSFDLAISPWDLLPDEVGLSTASETYLFPLLSSADLLVWRIPGAHSARKERLDRLFRMAWAAKKR
ncbi:MAG: hypothetical protein O6844_06280 [Gammaproteobacteria bacterium]|nr:hypothetical protein [Gammaproteobacteria bacterium]